MAGLNLTLEGAVARLELARPESANAFDLELARELTAAVARAREAEAALIVLTGRGARFCAGGDVKAMARSDDPPAYVAELATTLAKGIAALAEAPVPVVVAVQGAVAGAGLALMLAADVIVAAQGTRFATGYSAIGLTPDCGLSQLLPRAIGVPRALDLILTGRVLTTAEALDWGLVSRVVDADALPGTVDEIVSQWTSLAPVALGRARRLVREGTGMPLDEITARESLSISACLAEEKSAALVRMFADR